MKIGSRLWRRTGFAMWITTLVTLLGWVIWKYSERIGLVENHHKLFAFLLITTTAMVGYVVPRLLTHLKRQNH